MSRELSLGKLWKDRCCVIVREERQDPETKITDFVESVLFEELPCRLSYEILRAASSHLAAAVRQSIGETASVIRQSARLFLPVGAVVPPGSKIVVTRNGETVEYGQSGQAAVYTYHQEIPLEVFKRWA